MNEKRLSRFFCRMTLARKMLLITMLAGLVVWGVLDAVQTSRLRGLFEASLTARLAQQAREDRVRFDDYVEKYHQAAELIVSQKRFLDYVAGDFTAPRPVQYHHHELPPWLPSSTILRHLVHIDYAFLLDGKHRLREFYYDTPVPPPASLLRVSGLVQRLSHNQSFMTTIEDVPYLITSETAQDGKSGRTSTLMLFAVLDDEFLSHSRRSGSSETLVALVDDVRERIMASSHPDLLPVGKSLETLQADYLITGKSFFDRGASDLTAQFLSFIPRSEFRMITKTIIVSERIQRAVFAGVLLLSFVLIIFWITRHIGRLSREITDFTGRTFGARHEDIDAGDQLKVLEIQFRRLTGEVVEARERLKRQAEELLREKTVYLDTILQSSTLAIAATDLDFRIKYYNPAAERFFGYQAGEVVGKTVWDIHLKENVSPERFERGVDIVRKKNLFRYTLKREAASGELYLDSRVSGIRDAEGSLVGYVLMSTDITEQTLAEMKLKQKQKELEDLNRTLEQRVEDEVAKNIEKEHLLLRQSRQAAMGEMIGNIAHQWRQPLNNLGLIIQDLRHARRHGELDPHYLENSVREGLGLVNLMSQTIDDFRNFFKLEKAKAPFSAREVLQTTLSFVEAGFRSLMIIVELDVREDSTVTGYRNEFSQALMNIMNNARDALAARPEAGRLVRVRLYREGGKAVVTVSDNAGGVAGEFIDRIFDPYFTTKEQGKGTGIGLYMAKTIVEKNMGGRLTVSNVGDGAEFRIEV